MKKISVIIPTYNRKHTLRMTLAKLGEQTVPAADYEVVVVDDGSTDGTPDIMPPVISSVPYALKYFYQTNRGIGAAQNRAILEAEGDLVVIIADDILVPPAFLQRHLEFHAENPEPHMAALGPQVQSPDLPKSTVFMTYWDPMRYGYQRLKGLGELSYLDFWTGNLSLKRRFLLENGLFTEVGGIGHEDVELGYRLSQKGLRLFYREETICYHYHVESLEHISQRLYMKGLNWWVLSENIPDPEIYARYGVISLKSDLRTLIRNIVRATVYNGLTIHYLLIPLIRKAETTPALAPIAARFPWTVIHYYFRKGVAEARKQKGAVREHAVQQVVEKDGTFKATVEKELN